MHNSLQSHTTNPFIALIHHINCTHQSHCWQCIHQTLTIQRHDLNQYRPCYRSSSNILQSFFICGWIFIHYRWHGGVYTLQTFHDFFIARCLRYNINLFYEVYYNLHYFDSKSHFVLALFYFETTSIVFHTIKIPYLWLHVVLVF